MTLRDKVRDLLARADVTVDGDRPWDIRVHDERFFGRALAQGSLGVGESYMDGWWDCERLDEFSTRVLSADVRQAVQPWKDALRVLGARLVNLQRPARAFHIGRHHYDIGNDLFTTMLDRRMIYSCAYWKDARTLDEAQEAKLELVCRKLGLEPGMRVLDIGCGWGGMAQYAVQRHGVSVLRVERFAGVGRVVCDLRADGGCGADWLTHAISPAAAAFSFMGRSIKIMLFPVSGGFPVITDFTRQPASAAHAGCRSPRSVHRAGGRTSSRSPTRRRSRPRCARERAHGPVERVRPDERRRATAVAVTKDGWAV